MTDAENGPFDLLICDCDGVVIDSEVIADRVLNGLVSRAYPGHDVRAALTGYFGLHTRALLEKLAGLVGEPMAPSFVERVDREINAALRRDAGVVAGVREALEQISLPVAVVSNSRYDWIEFAVAKAGLTSRVGGAIFSAEGVARPKPAPDLYLAAARQLGFTPARCLVIEDSVSGVTAALAAGMSVLGFVGASHIPPGHADRLRALGVLVIVERMEELPAAVIACSTPRRASAAQGPATS